MSRVSFLGLILLGFWVADTINKIFIIQAPLRVLWYSSAGLGISAFALLFRNKFLIFSMFCALTVVESIWIIGFLSRLFFNFKIPGAAEYVFAPDYSKKDFLITMYHLFLAPFVLYASLKINGISSFGWAGASLFAGTLLFLTYLFVDDRDNINCLFKIDYCQSFGFLKFFYNFDVFQRVIVGVGLLTSFIFIPSNLLIYRIKIKSRRKE